MLFIHKRSKVQEAIVIFGLHFLWTRKQWGEKHSFILIHALIGNFGIRRFQISVQQNPYE